jgi:hypothetical protein
MHKVQVLEFFEVGGRISIPKGPTYYITGTEMDGVTTDPINTTPHLQHAITPPL